MWLRSQVQSRSERTYILYFEKLWTQNFDLLLHHILVLFWKNHTTTRHHDHRKPPRNWWPSWPRDLLSSALPDGKSNFFQMSHWVKNLTKLCAIIMSILFYARNRRAEISGFPEINTTWWSISSICLMLIRGQFCTSFY